MAQEIENNEPLTGGLVKPKDPVTVYATKMAKHFKGGEKIELHKALAEKLIAKGVVTKTKPSSKEVKA